MINALICSYKSGDVLPYTLGQLVECDYINRILVTDGPHLGNIKPGFKTEKPTVKEVVDSFSTQKIHYEYSDDCEIRGEKNNRILKNVLDCQWILCVDSDEVYHENDLVKLAEFLKNDPEWDRYEIKTINPFPDFHHCFEIPDWKPRLYRWYEGAQCHPKADRLHQYVNHSSQKYKPNAVHGMARLPSEIAQIYHLNALRDNSKGDRRVRYISDDTITWKGGHQKHTSKILPLDISCSPKCIRESKKDSL